MSRTAWLMVAFVVIAGGERRVLAEGDARMPTDEQAAELLAEGIRIYELGHKGDALALFERGIAIEPAPWLLFNAGQVAEELGELAKALAFFEQLADSPRLTGDQRSQIQARAARLRDLVPRVEPTEPNEMPPAVPAAATTEPLRERRQEYWYHDKVGWILVGAGVVGGLTAGGFALSASGLEAEANRTTRVTERAELRERAAQRRTTAVVLGIAGGAAFTAGIVKLAIPPGRKNQTATATVMVGFGPSWVQLWGEF